MANASQENQTTAGQNPFIKEQIEQLQKLLQPSSSHENPSCLFVQSSKHFPSCSFTCSKITWIIDSGASDHMTNCSKFFHSYKPCAGHRKVRIADDSFSTIVGSGTIKLSSSLILSDVLHVPKLSCNLISINKLTKNLKCCSKFLPFHCEFMEQDSRKMIDSAREIDGLCNLNEGTYSNKATQGASSRKITSTPSDREIYLRHFRLGHPSFFYLKHLFPDLFKNKNPSSFQYEICALSKHYKNSYLPRVYQPSKTFALIKKKMVFHFN